MEIIFIIALIFVVTVVLDWFFKLAFGEKESVDKVEKELPPLTNNEGISLAAGGLAIVSYAVAWMFIDVNDVYGSFLNTYIAPMLHVPPVDLTILYLPQVIGVFMVWFTFSHFLFAYGLEYGVDLWKKTKGAKRLNN